MEHSALHGIQLAGLVLVLSGPLFVWALLHRALPPCATGSAAHRLAAQLEHQSARWVCIGAVAAALAVVADLFVQSAELKGETVFGGLDLSLLARFALQTNAGRLSLARLASLAAVAALVVFARKGRWGLVTLFGAAALISSSLVSHAAAQPTGRISIMTLQILHILGATVWIGTLMHLLLARPQLTRSAEPETLGFVAEVVRRFSPIALAAAGLLTASGVFAALRLGGRPGALLASAYGLTLLVKLALLMFVLWAGAANLLTIRPALLRHAHPQPKFGNEAALDTVQGSRESHLKQFGRLLELEVTAGLLVMTVAGIVGSVSPPAGPGKGQLTSPQIRALVTPHWPRAMPVDPAGFYGAAERTLDDMRYAEFTHNWSGLAVALLGACWLVQAVSGRWSALAGRVWPVLLILFGIFIAVASDPEVWILRRATLGQVLRDPQVLEHQLGGVLVFVMAAFAWRDRRRDARLQPLGLALPLVMIGGSLLLLGHAHSTLSAGDEVTSLINVQHAVMGGLGLLAGTIRWLSLRGLISRQRSAWVWPALLILLGLFMAFFYRETC